MFNRRRKSRVLFALSDIVLIGLAFAAAYETRALLHFQQQFYMERERKILELRYGLSDGCPCTLEEVGRQYNVTRERIRQIEAKALRKLRHPTRRVKLEGFLENLGR